MKPYPKQVREKKVKTGQADLFHQLYNEGKNFVSSVSGRSIPYKPGEKLFYSCFAHILPKGSYPDLKFSPINIAIMTPHEHFLFDHGTKDDRDKYQKMTPGCDWDRIYRMEEILKRSVNLKNK